MSSYDFDLVVVGGGAGGLVASKLARGLGKKVAIIENNKLGGECTWTCCVPSKVLINIAHVAHQAKNLDKYGLALSPQASLSTDNVMAQIQKIIQKTYATHTPDKLSEAGINVLLGNPRFIDVHTLQLGAQKIIAKKIIIATGSSPVIPPIEGLDQVPFHTNKTIFNLTTLPQSIIMLGGGPIGIELASALNRLGTRVTVIEMNDHILPREDTELTTMLASRLTEEGVSLVTSIKVIKTHLLNNKIVVTCTTSDNHTTTYQADTLLVAVGRKPNIDTLDLEKGGIAYNKHGIITDITMRTSAPNIYAGGDVVGPYQFSHMAEYQALLQPATHLFHGLKSRLVMMMSCG